MSGFDEHVRAIGERFLSIKQVADILQVSPKQVRRLIENRDMPHYRIGRLYRVASDDLKGFLALRRHAR